MPRAANADKAVSEWANKTVEKGLLVLCNDFAKLKDWHPPNTEATAFNAPQNVAKNRSKVTTSRSVTLFYGFRRFHAMTRPAYD